MEFVWKTAVKEVVAVMGHFFEDFTPSKSSSLFQGFLHEYVDLRVKPDALHILGAPLLVEGGMVGSFSSNLDVASLISGRAKRFDVNIRNVRLRVTPSQAEHLSLAPLLEKRKQLNLVMAELFHNIFQGSAGGGFYELFLRAQVTIENVHITISDTVERFDLDIKMRQIKLRHPKHNSFKTGVVPRSHVEFAGLEANLTMYDSGRRAGSLEEHKLDFIKPVAGVMVVYHDYRPIDDEDEVDVETLADIQNKMPAEEADAAALMLGLDLPDTDPGSASGDTPTGMQQLEHAAQEAIEDASLASDIVDEEQSSGAGDSSEAKVDSSDAETSSNAEEFEHVGDELQGGGESSSEEAQSAGDAAEQGQGGGDSGASDGSASGGSASGGSASDSNAEAQSQSDAASDSDEDSDDEQDTDANTTDNDQDTDANTTDNPSDVVNEEDEPSLDLDGLSEAASSNFPTSRTDWSEDEEGSEYAEDEEYGWTFIVSLLTPLQVNVKPETLHILTSTFKRVTKPLFDDERGSQQNLDLLRWVPVRGHAREYWRYVLRRCLPMVVKKVAEQQGISMGDGWSDVYGLLSPLEHKEEYIKLYQRSLNLVQSDPLSPEDENKKKHLESLHASDTILIWRTEAKVRLIMERPSANMRLARQEYEELTQGLWSAMFTRVPDMAPVIELSEAEKREAFKQALKYHIGTLSNKVFSGWSLTLQSDHVPAARVRFLSDEPVMLELDDMLVELCYNSERVLVRAQAERFRELALTETGPRFFDQADGLASINAEFPASMWSKDSFTIFARYLHVLNTPTAIDFFTSFFHKRRTHERHRSSTFRLVQMQQLGNFPEPEEAREASLEVLISDSVLTVPMNPIAGSIDEFEVHFGNPFRSFVEELDPVYNIELDMQIKPDEGIILADLALRDMQVVWQTVMLDKEGRRKPLPKRRRRRLKKNTGFREVFMRHIEEWRFKAKLEQVRNTFLEHITLDADFGTSQARITERVLAQVLRICAHRIQKWEENQRRSGGRKKANTEPFSIRTRAQSLRVALEPLTVADQEREATDPSFVAEASLLASLMGAELQSSVVRPVFGRAAHEDGDEVVAEFGSTKESIARMFNSVLDQLVDGVIGLSRTSAEQTQHVGGLRGYLKPVLERLRMMLMDGNRWDRDYLEHLYVELQFLLAADVQRSDGQRTVVLCADSLESVMPQALSKALLDAFDLHDLMLSAYGDTHTKAYDHLSPQEVYNAEYLQLSVKKLCYYADASQQQVLSTNTELIHTLRRLERDNEVVKLSTADKLQLPNTDRVAWSLTVQIFEATFAARGHNFFLVVLEDFTNESERSSSYQDVEPDVSYDSFRLQFDVDLISHLLYLYTHRQESALATNATGSLVMVGMEIANLLNTYAYSDSIDSGEQVQMTLTIDDFHWEFLRRLESNKEFKLFADVTLAIPYAYFHPALHKEPLVILSRADVEMTVTKRRTPQRSHQNASWLKQQHDFVETTNVVGHLRKCEIFHALPASSRMPAGSFSQPDMRAATMNAASHLRNQMLEKLNAKEQEERDRVLEERRKREHEAKKAALAAGAEAPSDSDIPIHHPSDDEATRSRKKIYVSPEERKLQALMEEARQLRAEAARLRESGGASDIEDETDDLADLEDALAAAGRRLQSSSEEEESSMDEGSGGEGSMGESGFSDSDVPQAADVLPPLSQEYPLPKSAIRDKLGALVWRRVSQILEPTTISVHSGKENSGLNVHTSAEELRSFRKLINKRSQFYIDLPKDVHINMTMRDYFFLLRLLTKVLRRTRIGRAAAEVALGGGGDDNDHDDSKKEFEFRIKDGVGGDIIKHIQLLLQDEVELTLRSKWINILLLDGESDQSGRDPVLEIGLAGLTVWMSSFGSRVSLEADTTLSLGYGMLPDQVHDETTPTIGDAEIAPLLKPCPIELRLERDELTKHGSQHASMYMGTIKVRKEMLATLTRAFVLRTMRRLGSFTDIYYQLIGGEKLYTKPIEEDALREEELFDRRLLRNSTGTTLWYTHASRPGPGLSVVGNGAQKLINCNPALFHQQSSGDSPYAVDVQLDGNWSPSMGLELRSDYFQRFVVNSTMGPGYDRLQPKVVEVVCEAVYEDVPQSKLRGLPDEPTEQLVIDVHSTVQVTNDTLDPVYALESVVQPGESVWLPLMVVSTGEVSFRPSPEFSWTEPLKYPIPGVTETPETTGEVEAQEEVEGGEEGVEYVPKACRHSLTKQAWCYSLRVERDEKRGVTLIRVRSPIVLVNRLAAPLSVTITRPALKSIRFVWQSPAARAKALRRGKSNETITELAERGQVEPGKEWNVYGGGAYDQGIIRLHMKDSAECRVDGFTCRRGIDLSKPNQFKGGLVMQDERTGRTLYVYAADLASNPAEGRHFRRIVIFSQYQVIDYTCLQMKVSGDKMSYMSGHAPSKDTFTQTKETASLARIMYSFPPGTPDSGQTLHLSTPHCQRWSLPISVLEAVEELTDEQIASGDFELPSDVVRVPVSLHYSPLLSGQKSFGDLSLFTYFSAEVVATVRRSSLALFRQGRGPLVIECHPRVRLVNALGCAIAVRQLDTPSFRGSGPKDHEFPVVVPPGRTSPFVFYDDFDYESGLRPEPFIVKSLSVSPVFRSVPGRPVNSWEWSGQLPIHVSSTYSASCHNTNLSKRLIMKVKVKERQGYRTVVISNQNSRDVPFRVHNSSTQASVRFFQKPRGGADPTRRSLYKQTLHAGSTSALYAWDYPLDLDFEANDAGVDSVQYAPVLTVHVYATDGEVYEMDVDISSGRVGARHHLRLPGSQPDLLLQTRGDMETGAVVLVVSDYQLDAYSPLAAFETEEKRFLTTLMSKDRTVEQASLLLHDEAAQRLMESEADEAREPCVGYLTFRITGFEDVKFRDTVSVVYVVSFGKTTRKAIRDVRQVRREQFEEHTFYYNQHHDSEDDDYDTVYVDIYERHTFTGTTLKRTATIRRVHEVIKRTRRDRATFRVHLHNPAVKLHDDPSRKPKDHGTGFMTVEIATSSNLAPRVQHLPGTPRLMFTVACPSLKVSLVDERARTLLSAVSVRDKITIRQVLDRAEFGVLHLANLVSVSAHSSTHELTDLVLGNLELSKCFETDEASAAERKEREREARKKKKQQKGKRKSKKELQQLEDEVREHSYIISTDCSAESPLVHLQMLELEATRGFDHKVEEAALTMQPAWMKLDGPLMLRLIKYARLLELFVPAAQLDAESALARYRGLQVESLRINETAVHLSFTSARAPTLAGSSVEALAEASSAVASMASTAALSAFDMLKNSMTIEVTPRSERVVEEEPDAEDEDPTAQRGRIFVPAVEAPLSVHTSKRTYSSLLMEVLAHVAKYVVKDKLVEQRSNVEGMYGFRAIASYLTPMEQQLRKLREPVGELESLEDDGGLEDGL